MPNLRSEDSDFELRTARTGGEIMLRDEWLQAATSTYRVRSFRIRDLSVRQLGNAAITNFLDEQVVVSGGQNLTGNFFIVDAWEKAGTAWKLAARYSAGPGAVPVHPSKSNVKR